MLTLPISTGRSMRHSAGTASQRSQCRRNLSIKVSAGRRPIQEKASPKKEVEPRQCPCGSGMQFRECCAPIVGGAWARTAPELARARFTAVVMGEATMLADTTHPEALDAIGTKNSLRKKVNRFMRNHGADERPPSLADCVHGQSPDDPDSWFVLMAVAVGPPGTEHIVPIAEQYRKDAGRWWYAGRPHEFPALKQFEDFMRRYGSGEDDGVSPFFGRYDYSWLAFPPRPLPASEAQRRPQWLVDEWPKDSDGGGQGQGKSRGGWVYLDTAVDPETGLTAAQQASQMQRLLHAKRLQDAGLDWDSYYFRRGGFMGPSQ